MDINKIIENKFNNGIFCFEVLIEKDVYIIDISKFLQIKKSDIEKQRPIIRAKSDTQLNIIRVNRFTSFINQNAKVNNILNGHQSDQNLQNKVTITKLFKKEIIYSKFDLTLFALFNTEITLPSYIINELKTYFLELEILSTEEIISIIENELYTQANSLSLDNSTEIIKYTPLSQVKSYVDKLKEENGFTLPEKLIILYTMEGFLVYHINEKLRNNNFFTDVKLFFILLQASIVLVGDKYNQKNLIDPLIGDKIILYRGSKISTKVLEEDSQLYPDGKIVIFNEFLSTTNDYDTGIRFMRFGDLKEGLSRVLYKITVDIDIYKRNPNLLASVNDISKYEHEKEVLFSSSSIFKMSKIEKESDYYIVTMEFISNGYNKFDFIQYYSGEVLSLIDFNFSDEDIKDIILSFNNHNTKINTISFDKINSTYEIKIYSILLEINNTLCTFYESMNRKEIIIGKSVVNNTIIKELFKWNMNKMGSIAISKALEINTSLTTLDLSRNQIGKEGAIAISKALEKNTSLTTLDLWNNQIGKEEAIAISKALEINTSLS